MSHQEAIRANQLAVLRLTEPELTRILPVLQEIRLDTARGIGRMLRTSPASATYSMTRHGSLLLQLQKTIETARTRLPRATATELRIGSRLAGRASLERLTRMVNEGEKRFSQVVSSLRLPTASILMQAESAVWNRHASAAARFGAGVGARIQRDLAVGVVRGESIQEMARRLLAGSYERIAERGTTAVAEAMAERQFFASEHEATRLVRTELVNAVTQTEIAALNEINADDPGWMKRWDATLDMRTCADCRRLHGVIVGINELFPGGILGPPLHPNDRCTIVPWHSSWGAGPLI